MSRPKIAEGGQIAEQSAPVVSEVAIASLTAEEIAALPAHYRSVITARHFGRRYKVIAEDLGIPLGTVRSRINRARHAILKSRGGRHA